MDGLPQQEMRLETRLKMCVEKLIARMNAFQAENVRLRQQEAALRAENIKLAKEYNTLAESLRQERALRGEAYARISALLDKIRAARASQ